MVFGIVLQKAPLDAKRPLSALHSPLVQNQAMEIGPVSAPVTKPTAIPVSMPLKSPSISPAKDTHLAIASPKPATEQKKNPSFLSRLLQRLKKPLV